VVLIVGGKDQKEVVKLLKRLVLLVLLTRLILLLFLPANPKMYTDILFQKIKLARPNKNVVLVHIEDWPAEPIIPLVQ
jgi:uncharacterized membrane protein